MSEKTFWWKSALKSCHQKPCAAWLNLSLRTSLLSWITLAWRTVKLSGLLHRVVWR